jgi:DNA-binding protein Fis
MSNNEFEGTLILEQLARFDLLDDFMAAVDSQDFSEVRKILILAEVEKDTITMVLKKIADPYDEA